MMPDFDSWDSAKERECGYGRKLWGKGEGTDHGRKLRGKGEGTDRGRKLWGKGEGA